MTEEFLHYIWKSRNFENRGLSTTDGEPLEVIMPGDPNRDAGPDFFNARIRIGGTVWAGNVEMHLKASDWKKHGHQEDPSYDNIILHVVHEADEVISNKTGKIFPTLELKKCIPGQAYSKYQNLLGSSDWIPCGNQVKEIRSVVLESWLERLLIERLERKSKFILETLHRNHNNWEEAFYQHMARNFGFMVNALPFELLARSLPLVLLSRYRDNRFQLEALLFGQAGLLEQHFTDTYPQRLQNEYLFLSSKHALRGMNANLWKFLRLRPPNFPTLRIAQFAQLMHRSHRLFSELIDIREGPEIDRFLNVSASEYWKTHYLFDRTSAPRDKSLGSQAIENILINTVVPFLFLHGRENGDEAAAARALHLLLGVKPESNSIIRKWKSLGLEITDGARSQALLELKTYYCKTKRCLDCAVGRELLNR